MSTAYKTQCEYLEEFRAADALAALVRDGKESCCGEWANENYKGWCSKLGRPRWSRQIDRDWLGPRFEYCLGCPRAREMNEREAENMAWVEDFYQLIGG